MKTLVLSTLIGIGLISLFILLKPKPPKSQPSKNINQLKIISSAFKNNQPIPKKYTCQGEDINPPLKIINLPADSRSLAIIVEDPDAPLKTWNHWLVYNLPPTTFIKENISSSVGITLKNDFGKTRYNGPCPPAGSSHHYLFKIYALDSLLPQKIKTKDQLLSFIKSHLLAKGTITALYQRR